MKHSAIANAKTLGLFLYAALCSCAILVLSGKEYEWMVGGRDTDGTVFTLCTIPIGNDEIGDMAPFVLLSFVPLLVAGFYRLRHRRRVGWSLVLGLGLLMFWWWRYWGRALSCPAAAW